MEEDTAGATGIGDQMTVVNGETDGWPQDEAEAEYEEKEQVKPVPPVVGHRDYPIPVKQINSLWTA